MGGPGGHLPSFMADGLKLAVAGGCQPHMMARLGAVGCDGEALITGGNQPDRAIETAGSNGNPGRTGGGAAPRAEPAADIARDDAHVFQLEAELFCDGGAQAMHELTGFVDDQTAA